MGFFLTCHSVKPAHFAYAAWRLCSLFKMNAGTFGCDNGLRDLGYFKRFKRFAIHFPPLSESL
jgi:hypothetical protein